MFAAIHILIYIAAIVAIIYFAVKGISRYIQKITRLYKANDKRGLIKLIVITVICLAILIVLIMNIKWLIVAAIAVAMLMCGDKPTQIYK